MKLFSKVNLGKDGLVRYIYFVNWHQHLLLSALLIFPLSFIAQTRFSARKLLANIKLLGRI